MKVSFVIPAHNEQDQLPATLRAISAAARELALEHEIIVADDASTDSTASVSRSLGATVVSHDRRCIAATRNLGARAAGGSMLVFVDADTRVSTSAVGQAVHAMKSGAVAGGASVRFDGRVPLWARATVPLANAAFRLARLSGGCFFFCTREALEKAGWWDETVFVSEEVELAKALKRFGRFVVVRAHVTTSGRKLRTHSGMEFLALLTQGIRTRGAFVRDKSRLGLWYGPRREDPHKVDDASNAGSR